MAASFPARFELVPLVRTYRITPDLKKAGTADFSRGSGLCWIVSESLMVDRKGFEPSTSALRTQRSPG